MHQDMEDSKDMEQQTQQAATRASAPMRQDMMPMGVKDMELRETRRDDSQALLPPRWHAL